jgi:Peptidase propeptide and YPEB domain
MGVTMRRFMMSMAVCVLASAVAQAERVPVALPSVFQPAPAIVLAEGSDASRNSVIQEAQRRYKAQVVKVTEVTVGGRRAYELRLLSDQGRVWMVRVDAESGQELPGG